MKKPKINTPKPPVEGQLTINIFAIFISLFVFVFIQQAGILLINIMFSLNYPSNLDTISNFLGSMILIIFLTFLFGFATQIGFSVIRKTDAEYKIYLIYNVVTLLIFIIQGITVAMMVSPIYIAPNILLSVAIIYSLYSAIKGVPKSFVEKFVKQKR